MSLIFQMFWGYPSIHSSLVNVISQEFLQGISSNLAQNIRLDTIDELICLWWSKVKDQSCCVLKKDILASIQPFI